MMLRQPNQKPNGLLLIVLITFVDALSSCWFGYCQGVFAGVLVSDDFKHQFPAILDANVSGIVTSSFLLGAFFGSVLAFAVGDKLGRRKTIALGLLLNTAGSILQAASYSLPQLITGRVINGLGIGLTSTMTPVFLSECAPSHMRGKLVIIGASSNVSFFAVANWISYGVYFQPGPIQWRFPLAFPLIFPLIIVPALLLVPETPRWLLLVGKDEGALVVLTRLAGGDANLQSPEVVEEFNAIKSAILIEREDKASLVDVLLFRDKTHNLRRLILSCGTQLMQQFSGINALGFYLPTLLTENVGYDQQMSRLLAAVSSTVYLIAAFCSLFIIDRFGRRKMMLYGSITMGICHIIAAVCLKESDENISRRASIGSAATAMFIIYHVFFGTSWGGVPWVYSAEVNSLGWRTRGAAAATSCNWLGGFAVTQFTKVGIDNLHWAFYLIFGIICFTFYPIVFCFYPETANRTLEDMDYMFIQNPSIFVFRNQAMIQTSRPSTLSQNGADRIGMSESSL